MENKLIANEEVTFTVKDVELKGILILPDSESPYRAMVLLHGSDRSSMYDPYYVEHAEKLIRSGYAVLRYDGPGWASETLEYRREEALAAVRYLQSRPDIKPSAVGLWGISQGGWICQMAAAASGSVAFIIPVSGPGVTPAEQEVYRVEAMSKAAGFAKDEVAKAVLLRQVMIDAVINQPMYQQSVLSEVRRLGDGPWNTLVELAYNPHQMDSAVEFEKIIGVFKSIKDERWAEFLYLNQILETLNNLPPQAWEMAKTQMQAVMEVDPANFLTKVHCPVLAIFGESDTSIPVEKSVALYQKYLGEAGNASVTFKVFANASHTIRIGEQFADGYFDLMVDWLTKLHLS